MPHLWGYFPTSVIAQSLEGSHVQAQQGAGLAAHRYPRLSVLPGAGLTLLPFQLIAH